MEAEQAATSGAAAYLTVRGLVKNFAGDKGVHSIDFDVAEGEFVTLLGSSGCGKTTTLRCLSGVETPDSGEITVDGRAMFSGVAGVNLPPERRDVGVVFQSYALWPHMSVRKNIGYPLAARKVPKGEINEKVEEILALVGLTEHAGKVPSALSGGQQQRVALARALVYKPKLLLLDEPLSNLDAQLRESMRRDIRRIQRQLGITAIYVTHDRVEAMTMSDRIIVMSDGRIDQVGAPEELFAHPHSATVAALLTSASLIRGRLSGGPVAAGAPVTVAVEAGASTIELGARAATDLAGNSDVAVCIRPRDVRLSPVGSARKPNQIRGVLLDRYSTGNEVEYVVDIGGRYIKSVSSADLGLEVGDSIAVDYNDERALCVSQGPA